jgi:hypothetical protein
LQQWQVLYYDLKPQLISPGDSIANNLPQLDKLVGLGMLVAASVVFLYYTIWTLLMVRSYLLDW